MKKLTILASMALVASVCFTLLHIRFSFDVAALAFPLSAFFMVFLVYYVLNGIILHLDVSKIAIIRKLFEYLPFVLLGSFILRRAGKTPTEHWFDVLSIVFWVLVAVFGVLILYFTHDKRFAQQDAKIAEALATIKPQKPAAIVKIIREIFEWLDAFLQAAFIVLLINIFIFQLYAIPSESMVPEFLVGDRVIVFKTPSGPTFPLSDISLPRLRSYSRGDIVVFRNPHYNKDRQSEVRNFMSQLVYMLTFTTVNLNVDEQGNLKADPLVKRITGVPGEQLMLVDGILYARTAESPEFKAVQADAGWAEWNLNDLTAELKKSVRDFPLSTVDYTDMIAIEKERAAFTYAEMHQKTKKLVDDFIVIRTKFLSNSKNIQLVSNFSAMNTATERMVYTVFNTSDDITRQLLTASDAEQWFAAFMTDWTNQTQAAASNLYEDSMFRLNLLVKYTMGQLIVRNAQLIVDGISATAQLKDSERLQLLSKAIKLYHYVQLNNGRNMAAFPANDQNGKPRYIPAHCFFMMGDNRFNSLDMRHSYNSRLIPLTELDKYSTTYYSNVEPQWIHSRYILGTALFRFWPVNRLGIPGNTAK